MREMNLMGMRFKGFTWENNPTSLTVSEERAVTEALFPYAGTAVQDLGRKKRRVKGEGYFSGPDCWEQFATLREAYLSGGPGDLQLPGQRPFRAVMESLKILGAFGKDLVKYGFSFTETFGGTAADGVGRYIAKAGESLWDYTQRTDRSIEELTKANPNIRDIGCLREGEEVLAP